MLLPVVLVHKHGHLLDIIGEISFHHGIQQFIQGYMFVSLIQDNRPRR